MINSLLICDYLFLSVNCFTISWGNIRINVEWDENLQAAYVINV